MLGRGAEPDVDRGDLLAASAGRIRAPVRSAPRARRPSCRSRSVVDVLGGRPQHDVAEHRRATSTPFVVAVGTGSMMWRTSGRASLSKTISSPRRGVTVKRSWPKSQSISSAWRPAAFTTQRACDQAGRRLEPWRVAAATWRRRTRRVQPERDAVHDRLGRERERRRERADDALVGNLERAGRAGPEMRLEPRPARRRRPARSPRSRWRRALAAIAGKRRELLGVPGHQQRAELLDRNARAPGRRPRAARGRAARAATRAFRASCRSPVCRMAVLALLVPVPTSSPASSSTTAADSARASRAIAVPTTPAPIMATS